MQRWLASSPHETGLGPVATQPMVGQGLMTFDQVQSALEAVVVT